MFGFIYLTTNNINGKKYVGHCKYSKKTWKTYLGSGKHILSAIKKYGKDSFSRVILEEATSKEHLIQLEEYYIKLYDAANSNNFYNISEKSYVTRGFSGKKHTKQRNKRISEILKGKKRPPHVGVAVSKSRKGHTKSEETILKHKEKVSGKNHFKSQSITINGIEYGSMREAAKRTGFNYYQIRKLNSSRTPSYNL